MGKRCKKQKNAFFAAIIFSLVSLFSACAPSIPVTGNDIIPGVKENTIFVASDLHLYSDNLLGTENEICVKENFSSDGRIQEYDYALINALIDQVNQEKPAFLILTGDLSYNGERDSHVELAKLLSGIEETKVLVIPGNHDMYSLSAFSALEDKTTRIRGIDMDDFREIYTDFGYTGAYSYDEDSLSYIYEISEDTWALMLDTTLSEYNEDNDLNIVGGYVDESTMVWLEEHLNYAKEHDISVISFSHHNLLVHSELFQLTHTINNYEDLLDLYSEYDVTLNLSGHLHIQSIKEATVDEDRIYDISSGSLLDYGNRYGRLDIYDNCYSYESCLVDFEDRDYAFQTFYDKYYAKTVKKYQNILGEEQGAAVTALLSEINTYYFDGSYEKIHALAEENKKLIKLIKKNTAEYETSYIKSIIEVENKDQHRLIIER